MNDLKWQRESSNMSRGSATVGGNVGDHGFLIVVPPALTGQILLECRRYLQPQTFDLMLYIGMVRTRERWWQTARDNSKHANTRKIVIASTTVSSFSSPEL
jgi:hypothetical protein